MRILLTSVLLFVLTALQGQTFSYPAIAASGTDLEYFVPSNWTILKSATGDLNKDKAPDAAFVLQYRDSIPMIDNYGDTVITQPRMFVIVLKDSTNKFYNLAVQNTTFILRHEASNMDDPFEEISIDKGILSIKFNLFMNAGGWTTSSATHKFRYQEGKLVLIGAEHHSSHRASMDYDTYSYNFLTKKRSHSKGNHEGGKEKITWKTLKLSKLKTLETLAPFEWQDNYDKYYQK